MQFVYTFVYLCYNICEGDIIMQLLLNRIGRLFSSKEGDTYCVGYADYIFITDEGVECKIEENPNGGIVLFLLCLEKNQVDPGREAEMKYDFFPTLEKLQDALQKNNYYIEWGHGDCFSVSVIKYNTIGKIMSGKYRGCRCMIEDNHTGEYTLFIYKKESNDCEKIMIFDSLVEMKTKLDFIIEFPYIVNEEIN